MAQTHNSRESNWLNFVLVFVQSFRPINGSLSTSFPGFTLLLRENPGNEFGSQCKGLPAG